MILLSLKLLYAFKNHKSKPLYKTVFSQKLSFFPKVKINAGTY
jgi:hypothetical protein